jgi:hypothetical protein
MLRSAQPYAECARSHLANWRDILLRTIALIVPLRRIVARLVPSVRGRLPHTLSVAAVITALHRLATGRLQAIA